MPLMLPTEGAVEAVPYSSLVDFGIRSLVIGATALEAVPSGDDWEIGEPIVCAWTMFIGHQTFVIPHGMGTDLASVPRVMWPMFPPHKRIKRAAVLHDALYQLRPFLETTYGVFDPVMHEECTGEPRRITRAEADKLLYVACIAEGMSRSNAETIYLGVRVGGSGPWHTHDDAFKPC